MAWTSGEKKSWSTILAKPTQPKKKALLVADVERPKVSEAEPTAVSVDFVAPTKLEDAKQEGISCVVLDSGAIIGGAKVDRLGPFVTYYTIPEVIEELKDERSKHLLDTFPYPITTHWVDAECFARVKHFSSLTGDLHSLSTVDLKVLALTYQLEKKLHGVAHIRTAPVITNKLLASHPGGTVSSQALSSGSLSRRFEVKAPLQLNDMLYLSADEFKQKHPEREEKKEEKTEDTPKTEEEEEEEGKEEKDTADQSGDDSDAGEWITADNVNLQDHTIGEEDDDDTGASRRGCVCITRDFAMQNVLLQMGLGLISVNGVAVKSVVAWSLKCYACNEAVMDMWRQFCPACGGHTLSRVCTTVDTQGNVRHREFNRKRFNKRGTQFAMKKAKGGRKNKDEMWREDTAYDVEFVNYHREKNNTEESLFDRGIMFGMAATGVGLDVQQRKPALSFGAASAKPKIGMGSRNPNQSRRMPTQKNRRRNRRRR